MSRLSISLFAVATALAVTGGWFWGHHSVDDLEAKARRLQTAESDTKTLFQALPPMVTISNCENRTMSSPSQLTDALQNQSQYHAIGMTKDVCRHGDSDWNLVGIRNKLLTCQKQLAAFTEKPLGGFWCRARDVMLQECFSRRGDCEGSGNISCVHQERAACVTSWLNLEEEYKTTCFMTLENCERRKKYYKYGATHDYSKVGKCKGTASTKQVVSGE